MHSDDGLKARISRSKFMKAVVDKEIKRLEKELKELGKYY